jgi:hypothetical protein
MIGIHVAYIAEIGLEVRGQKQSSSDFAHDASYVLGKFRQNPFHI